MTFEPKFVIIFTLVSLWTWLLPSWIYLLSLCICKHILDITYFLLFLLPSILAKFLWWYFVCVYFTCVRIFMRIMIFCCLVRGLSMACLRSRPFTLLYGRNTSISLVRKCLTRPAYFSKQEGTWFWQECVRPGSLTLVSGRELDFFGNVFDPGCLL